MSSTYLKVPYVPLRIRVQDRVVIKTAPQDPLRILKGIRCIVLAKIFNIYDRNDCLMIILSRRDDDFFTNIDGIVIGQVIVARAIFVKDDTAIDVFTLAAVAGYTSMAKAFPDGCRIGGNPVGPMQSQENPVANRACQRNLCARQANDACRQS